MGLSGSVSCHATVLCIIPLLVLIILYACLLLPIPASFFRPQHGTNMDEHQSVPMLERVKGLVYPADEKLNRRWLEAEYVSGVRIIAWEERLGKENVPKDELDAKLQGVSMQNKTLIIAILNKAYVEENGMLDLFLQCFQEEENQFLIRHILFVAVDETAFNRCCTLELHCYKLTTDEVNFSKEAFYMSNAFNEMMWRRTLFLGDILRRGYNFIFTDMDVLWLRNPFSRLSHEGEDLQLSCDFFFGNPFHNPHFNTGFYFVSANNKTIALFDEWYALRNNSTGKKDQDVLQAMMKEGAFTRLGLRVRYLETTYFSGFCQMSQDSREVIIVHANCCVSVKVKLIDLSKVFQAWKSIEGNLTSDIAAWPPKAGICLHDTTVK
ncbi:hypothetical protein ZIOFF_003668 [Zingiber officinale]|uniref:Glycosyltransferase n=1 Tax=Zingiber officinale TaxID=94328 RepID=A0A8J5LTN2_ZINOF|nr:hypothetical protein ZIOFF_003668 [Zingiber officinale]